jgi:DNA-binding MarR family transcriptional regulator
MSRQARDRPKEIAELVEPPEEGPAATPRLTVEIRPPVSDPPPSDAPREVRPGRRPAPRVDPAALQLSQRILLHLQRLGAFGVTEVAPVGATQIGMTEALGVRQSSLTKVLTRLVAAGALTESKGHVEGAPRRLKIYRLTPLGESVARDLRRRASTGRVAPSREPWGPSAR